MRPFGAGDWEAKRANADGVRQQFGLALSRGPIFGLVARLVHQKGVDLVLAAADAIVSAGGQTPPRPASGRGGQSPQLRMNPSSSLCAQASVVSIASPR